MITALIVTLICSIGFGLAYRKFGGGSSAKLTEKLESQAKKLQEIELGITKELARSKDLVSARQIATVQVQISTIEASIAQERAQLQKVEATLSKSQQDVEQRENTHQNLKIAKEDEEDKLNALLERHESLSAESMQLEQGLAESMKNLDKLMSEAEFTENQKSMMKDLQNALEAASARLRELIAEYEAVSSRVESLRQQHLDLEEEYTRLVELQLG